MFIFRVIVCHMDSHAGKNVILEITTLLLKCLSLKNEKSLSISAVYFYADNAIYYLLKLLIY